MAIAFDNSTPYTATTTVHTYSHTCTGSDLILWVSVEHALARNITSITYAGVSMTLHASATSIEDFHLYYLENPATGANNVSITLDASGYLASNASSYTGAELGGQPFTSSTSSAATKTSSVTTTIDNCWAVLAGRQHTTGDTNAGTGTTEREANAGWSQFYDSGGSLGTAGSKSLETTQSAVGQTSHVMASFAPKTAASRKGAILAFF